MQGATPNFYDPIIRGPETDEPLPTLFYFALSGRESLERDPLNTPVILLAGRPLRIVSFSLPYHDEKRTPDAAMQAWADDVQAGKDPLKEFLKAAQENISLLFDKNWIDPERCAVAGVSRGAFAAVKLAALDKRLTHILGWAPLIDFSHRSLSYSLFDTPENLIGRPLHFLMSNNDMRVDTDIAYRFIRTLVEVSTEEGVRSPPVELSLKPPIGYKGHGTAPETFKEGVDWLLKQFKL